VSRLDPILAKLARAQTEFFRAANSIPTEQWNTKPSKDAWSAAELVAHLVIVERAVLGGADRITQKMPRAVPIFKRWHLPLWLVESRIIRRKSPLPLDGCLLRNKEEMLAELRGARERSLAFLDETRKRDLSGYYLSHAFLGMLNVYQWFDMLASHELRHTKQMCEIAEHLPKVVEIAQE